MWFKLLFETVVVILLDQQKVTGWSQPESNATGASGNNLSAEINALGDAQVVSSTAPEFVEKADDPMELQKGPAKKYIDNPNGNNDNNNENNNNATTVETTDYTNPTDNTVVTTENNNNNNNGGGGGGYDDFFAGMGNDGNDNNNDGNNDNTHPTNATMISLPNVGDNDANNDVNNIQLGANDEAKEEAAPTALRYILTEFSVIFHFSLFCFVLYFVFCI